MGTGIPGTPPSYQATDGSGTQDRVFNCNTVRYRINEPFETGDVEHVSRDERRDQRRHDAMESLRMSFGRSDHVGGCWCGDGAGRGDHAVEGFREQRMAMPSRSA